MQMASLFYKMRKSIKSWPVASLKPKTLPCRSILPPSAEFALKRKAKIIKMIVMRKSRLQQQAAIEVSSLISTSFAVSVKWLL